MKSRKEIKREKKSRRGNERSTGHQEDLERKEMGSRDKEVKEKQEEVPLLKRD